MPAATSAPKAISRTISVIVEHDREVAAPAFGSVVDGVGESGTADKIVADTHPEHHDEVVLLQHRPTSRLALGQQGWKRGS